MDLSKHWTVKRLAYLCQGQVVQGRDDLPIRSISIDTRTLKKGELFWALEGAGRDGNNFAAKAAQAGAGAAVVSRDFPPGALPKTFPLVRVSRGLVALGRFAEAHRLLFNHLCVVAVTGSNGKTTTKEMAAKILSRAESTVASPGNFNNEIGCPLSLFEISEKHRYAVLELAARKAGDIEYLSMLAHPNIALLTNINSAHLATFGSLEKTWEAKSEILRGMDRAGRVIYWAEDPWLAKLADLGLSQKLISFGLTPQAHVRGEVKEITASGSVTEVFRHAKKIGQMNLKLLGRGNILNALAACAAAFELGVSAREIFSALKEFQPLAMRGETLPLGGNLFGAKHVLIHDAYNANPSSMADSVAGFLNAYRGWKKIIVLGNMHELGEDSGRLHEETAGAILEAARGDSLVDKETFFILVGAGPIVKMAEALAAGAKGGHYEVWHHTRAQAVEFIRRKLAGENAPCAVLFKASRVEAFEEMVEELKL